MRSPILAFGPYNFDPNSRLLSRAGTELPLPPRVIGVLEVLLRRAGDVVARQELIESVWKDAFVTDTSLGEAVSALRQALGDDPQTPIYVQTLHRRGYRFVAPVAPVLEPARVAAPVAAERQRVPLDTAPSIHGVLMPWGIAAICAAVAAVALLHSTTATRTADPPIARFAIPLAAGTRLDSRGGAIALSPDARAMAWSGCDADACRLFVRRLDRLDAERIAGTEGAASPFFSPDGQWIGFFAGGQLKKVALAGGAPVRLADAPEPRGAVWLQHGAIVFARSDLGGLLRVAAEGGEPAPLTQPRSDKGEIGHAWPALSPRGDLLLFTIFSAPGARAGRLGTLRLNAQGMGTGWQTLAAGIGTAASPADDVLLFGRGGELHAAWFDNPRSSIASPPSVVSPVARAAGGAQFAVSRSGALLVGEPTEASGESLVWLQGTTPAQVPELDRPLQMLTLSPDGRFAAGVEEIDDSRSDVWVADLSRGTTTRLTHGGVNTAPVWAGDSVLYASKTDGAYEIWKRGREGATPAERIHRSARDGFPLSATADGALFTVLQTSESNPPAISLIDVREDTDAPLTRPAFEERAAALSPDGSCVAYESAEAGRWDVYVLRRADSKRAVVSRAGGSRPLWAADGKSLYYRAGRQLVRVAFDGRDDLRIGPPEPVAGSTDAEAIGVAPDGRILIRRAPLQPATLVVALGWVRELRQVLGPPPAVVPR